jgi:hypothetical protein
MNVPEQVSLPRNTVTAYDVQLQQALIQWMRRAALAINRGTGSGGGGGGASTLNDLTDVVITAPVLSGQVITFDGANWVNDTISGGGGGGGGSSYFPSGW